MTTMTYQDRVARLDTLIAENRLIRKAWIGEENGRETACLLAALSPEAGQSQRASACPANVIPAWLAELTPWMDDSGSVEAWPGMVRRYAGLARRWSVLTPEAWTDLGYQVVALCVREAMRHTKEAAVLAICERVIELLGRWRTVTQDEWRAAAAAAGRWAAAAAADHLTTAILDSIEASCVAA